MLTVYGNLNKNNFNNDNYNANHKEEHKYTFHKKIHIARACLNALTTKN